MRPSNRVRPIDQPSTDTEPHTTRTVVAIFEQLAQLSRRNVIAARGTCRRRTHKLRESGYKLPETLVADFKARYR